jgi:hypothetical protein
MTIWRRDLIFLCCDLSSIYLLGIDLNLYGSVRVNSVSYIMMLAVD